MNKKLSCFSVGVILGLLTGCTSGTMSSSSYMTGDSDNTDTKALPSEASLVNPEVASLQKKLNVAPAGSDVPSARGSAERENSVQSESPLAGPGESETEGSSGDKDGARPRPPAPSDVAPGANKEPGQPQSKSQPHTQIQRVKTAAPTESEIEGNAPAKTSASPVCVPEQVPSAEQPSPAPVEADASPASAASKSDKPFVPAVLPKRTPVIKAPEKFNHPLKASTQLVFMLGQDDEGNYLYGEGAIDDTAFQKFKRYVDHYASIGIQLDRLMMHSPGGLVIEGLKIGQYIRENGWATDSDRHMMCYSACGLIFASGVKKRMQSGAKVGFHRPYNPHEADTQEFIDNVYVEYQSYWNSIGGSPALYDAFMKNYGREDMLILMAETASQYMDVEVY